MDSREFREFANATINYITQYLNNIRKRRVLSDVKPGYIRELLPEEAPMEPDSWQNILRDVERVIMPGITHWQSPRFHAYFPTASSYPSIIATILESSIACNGLNWMASPVCTELENVTLDWLGKMIHLPDHFLFSSGGKGGGVIQSSASEATYITLLGAKAKKMKEVKEEHPDWDDSKIISKLVGYCSAQAHSSVERAGLLGGIKLEFVEADESNRMCGAALEEAIKKDLNKGLVPFYIVISLGTTNTCAFDKLNECGAIGNKYNLWVHIDAAYAGSAFICPEFRHLMNGIETADSFDFNPHKWLLVNSHCSTLWVKDSTWIANLLNVNVESDYHEGLGSTMDYRNWQIPSSRTFNALKLWFVLRIYGVENLQSHIRRQCQLARQFGELCKNDNRFEIVAEINMGLVCFRLKGTNQLNHRLLEKLHQQANIFLVPGEIRGLVFLRMAVCSRFSINADIEYSWREICTTTDEILGKTQNDGSKNFYDL